MAIQRSVVIRLVADVRGMSAGMDEAERSVTRLDRRVAAMTRAVRAAAAESAQASQRVAAAKRVEASMTERAAAAEQRATSVRAAASAAATRVGEAEARLEAVRSSGSASAAQIAAAEQQVTRARARHDAVTNAAASAEQRLTAAQELQARAAAQVTAAEERATAATNAHAAAAQRSIARTQAWNAAAGKMAMVGGTIGLGLGLAVKQFMDFDEAMSGVRANLSGTPAEMDAVQNAVRQAGAASVFSATEAANAAEELAKAGLTAADITGGALTGSMDLAAAGGVGLARAAEVAATAMAQFQLKGQDVAHIADVMAAGALASTASIDSLAQGMAQGGGMAASLGMSLEQTVGALSLFDQNALKGSDGGTALKTMLMSLTPNSVAAATAMEDVGLQAFDANGKFVGLTTVAEQLKNGMKDMGEEQRLAALKTIFGADAARAANVLYQQGAAGLQDYIDKVSESGVAAQVAAAKLNNAKGDLEKLKGDFENVLIGAGEGANGPIRGLIQNVDKLVSAFGELPSGVQSGVVQIAAFGSAGLLAAAGVIKMVNTIRSVRSGIVDMAGKLRDGASAFAEWVRAGSSSGTMLAGLRGRAVQAGNAIRNMGVVGKVGLGLLAAGLVAAGVAAATAGPQIDNFGRSGADLGRDLRTAADGGKNFDSIFSNMSLAAARDQSLSLSEATRLLGGDYDKVDDKADKFFTGILKGVGAASGAANSLEAVKGRFKGVGDELASLVQDGRADEAARQFSALAQAMAKNDTGPGWDKSTSAADRYKAATKALMGAMPGYSDALARASTEQKKNADATNAAALSAVKAGNANDQQKKSVDDLADSYKNLNNLLLQQRGGARGYQAALDAATDALKENGRTLDITTEKGRNNQEALDSVASSAGEWASSVLKATGDQQRANSILQDGRQQYIDMAMAMGMGREEATKLANEMVKIDGVNTVDVKVDGVKAAKYEVDELGNSVARLDGSKVEIPAETPNAPQVLQTLTALGLTAKQLSSDGTKVSIPTEALKAPETRAAIMGIEGATKDAQGNVTIPTSALSADATRNALKQIDNIALQADGRVVIIPASTPNAAAVKQLLEGVDGAAVSADGRSVSIPVASPNSPATKRLLNQVEGAALSADKKSVTVPTSALGAVTAKGQIDGVIQSANAADGKVARVSIITTKTLVNEVINRGSSNAVGVLAKARGGVMFGDHEAFARGGVREDHEPQIARPTPGRVRVWAEPETQGEAYIPFANDGRRGRAKSITEYVARRFGGSVTWHADGSADDWTPDMSGIMQVVSAGRVDPSKVEDARKKWLESNKKFVDAVEKLYRAQSAQAGKTGAALVKAAEQTRKAKEAWAKADDVRWENKRQYDSLASAAKLDTTGRFMQATGQQNGISQRFLDNIERIRKRGFPRLARSLLEQGDSDAQAIAQTLSGGKLDQLKSAQAGLDTSDKLADRKTRMLDDLKGVSTAGMANQAQAQANAQLLAMRGAQAALAYTTGVREVQAPVDYDRLMQLFARNLPAPVMGAPVTIQMDSREVGHGVMPHTMEAASIQASYGSLVPGMR